jgi:flagellar motor switch protein FliM
LLVPPAGGVLFAESAPARLYRIVDHFGGDPSSWRPIATLEKNLARNFMKTAKEELAKFERKEIEFQKMERNQRATQLNLPMPKNDRPPTFLEIGEL